MERICEQLVETGFVPDSITRMGIRQKMLLKSKSLLEPTIELQDKRKLTYIQGLKQAKIALNTQDANEQHYELPTRFFELCLGSHLKYSCCLFDRGATSLDQAEKDMLALYTERAQITDGMTILDLGCGWGSLSLYLAQKYPNSKIVGLSNSATQKTFIDDKALNLGLSNLEIVTADMNVFETDKVFDRVISIEMLEHMKNYHQLLEKVSKWIKPETGRLFVHVFAHREMPYDFNVTEGWMAKYFFAGGTMPCKDLFMFFQNDLLVLDRWVVDGKNYGATSNEWLKRMDANKAEIMQIFKDCYGPDAQLWFTRWRMFYLAVAECFDYDNGQEWIVMHYLFKRR